jgi:proteasome lid subunit RPN8/RPN11
MNDDGFLITHTESPLPGADDDFRVIAREAFRPPPVALGIPLDPLYGFVCFIGQAALTNLLRHGEQGLLTEQEVAGGLVGEPGVERQTGVPFTRIRAALAVQGRADRYEVEIPPESWWGLSTLVREDPAYRGTLLLGWYHSHPTFDAYLSPIDQLTQRQFFAEDWQIAIVVAPQQRQVKAFHGAEGRPCALFLDPAETGGALVPVAYGVSPGAVSTPAGIEWLAPPADPAPRGAGSRLRQSAPAPAAWESTLEIEAVGAGSARRQSPYHIARRQRGTRRR